MHGSSHNTKNESDASRTALALDASEELDLKEWPDSLTPFKAMDESLRCPICKELFDAAMILPCIHTFCSLCIRQSLLVKMQCPSCGKDVTGLHALKNNRVLDDLVWQYKEIRSNYMIPLMQIDAGEWVLSSELPLNGSSNQSVYTSNTTQLEQSLHLSQKTTPSLPASPCSTRRHSARQLQKQSTSFDASEYNDDIDSDFTYTPNSKSKRQRLTRSSTSSNKLSDDELQQPSCKLSKVKVASPNQTVAPIEDFDGASSSISTEVVNHSTTPETTSTTNILISGTANVSTLDKYQPQGNDLVVCPICSDRLKVCHLNAHLDNGCKSSLHQSKTLTSPTHSTTSRVFLSTSKTASKLSSHTVYGAAQPADSTPFLNTNTPKRLPKPYHPYSLLSDAKIKKMLKDDGLNSTGPRKLLIERHTEWITRYNANLDSRHPLSDVALRVKLVDWERSKKNNSHSHATPFKAHATHHATTQDQIAVETHLEKYSSGFDSLVEQIQAQRARKKAKIKDMETTDHEKVVDENETTNQVAHTNSSSNMEDTDINSKGLLVEDPTRWSDEPYNDAYIST
ncbi:E3 ubiquitin-protein ligase rad18 [Batrachochytrium dendrobatidis]